MPSQSEVGHNKNVANLDALCQLVTQMGPLYNPSNQHITLENLKPVQIELKAAVESLNQTIPVHRNLIAERRSKIAPLDRTCTRVLNSFRSLDVADEHKEKLEGLTQKIRGDKHRAVNPQNADANTISTSQQSYDSRLANFDAFIEQLRTHPEYMPNETELKTNSLTTYHTELSSLNTTATAAGYAVLAGRNDRNTILYSREASVMELQRAIKAYLLSLGDPAKHYYKAAVKLKFKDLL